MTDGNTQLPQEQEEKKWHERPLVQVSLVRFALGLLAVLVFLFIKFCCNLTF